MIRVRFFQTNPNAVKPYRVNASDACYDLATPEDFSLEPGETKVILLGFKTIIPKGFEVQIRARSGLALRGITVTNSPGTIDPDYRGEWGVIMTNLSKEKIIFQKGDRIAQCSLQMIFDWQFLPIDDLGEDTERSVGGFGSTGMN